MASAVFVSALGNFVSALFLIISAYVYVSLIRQISARPALTPDSPSRVFGLPEAIVAAFLISFLLLNVIAAVSKQSASSFLSTRDLVINLILIVAVVLILVGFLKLRGFDLEALGGFSKIGIIRAIGTGAVLLILSYPLINLADALTQRVLRSGSSKQNIVELFNGSHTIQQRVMIIVLAVAIAPMAEEFVFRFFIYGVLKRYFGRFAGLTLNALLFAAVHVHLPSFAPLFVLAACFTLAYEWSGSILVSMAMHSLFNSLTLTALAFPQLAPQ